MAFTLEPKAGPHTLVPSTASAVDQTQSTKARAIQALMGNQGQAQPAVPNQNNISPEELGALKTDGQKSSSVQSNASEETTGRSTESPAKTEAPKAEPLSDKYAALARRERQLRNEIRAFKAQQEAAKVPAAPTFDESKYISKDRLEQDLLGTLGESGYSYDRIVEQALGAHNQDPYMKAALARMEGQIKAQAEANAKLQSSLEDQQNNQRKQAVNQIRLDTQTLIKNDPNFETIRETNSVSDVVELIEKTFDEDGVLLSVEEAAQAVEDHLLEEAMKLTKIGKIQQRLKQAAQAAPTKATQQGAQAAQQQQTQSKTLTNNMGTTRQLSARERAILAAKGELK